MSIDEIGIAQTRQETSSADDTVDCDWVLIRANDEFDAPDRVTIADSSFTVGRSDDGELTLASASVSRKHAQLFYRNGRLVLEDLGSTNGTFVNGKPIDSQRELEHGDIVHFGVCSFTVARVQREKSDPRKTALEMKFQALKERREDPRCEVVAPQLIDLVVCRQSDHSEFTGRLTTLSRRAITFTVTADYAAGDSVTIEFRDQDAPYEEQLSATVIWVRPVGDEQSDVGCRIDDGDVDRICDKLGAAGIINRRQRSERIPVDFPAQAYFELDDAPHPVQLLNYSFGGFCLRTTSEDSRSVGSKLRLGLNADVTVFAQIRWTKPCDDGIMIGCEFFGPSRTKGSQIIREVVGG